MEVLYRGQYMNLEKDGKLAWITFCRERYLNAMNNASVVQLSELAKILSEEKEIRIVIVRGQGRAFCTGIDLKELAEDKIEMDYHRYWESALRMFEIMEKLIIVGMHGYCLGGGLQLALAADIRVSTVDCQIGLPAIKESLIPGLATWRLPRYIGWGRAKKMILGGQNIDGKEAQRIGLVDHVAPTENFFDHLDAVAGEYLAACSTGTRLSKIATNMAFDRDFDDFYAAYFQLQKQAQEGPDAQEAKRAYLANETPVWQ